MAEGGCPFPPWDPRTEAESGMFDDSPYRDLLRRHRVKLRDKLQVSKLWAHLRQLKVLTQNHEERIREGAARCDAVERLLDHIITCHTWQYHGFLRALALTGQAALIPEGGLDRSVYMQGAQGTPPPLTQEQCRMILDHCEAYVDKLMRRTLFTFEDPEDRYVDTSLCHVISKASFKGLQQKMQEVEADDILSSFKDERPPKTVILFGPAGAGKTTYTTHFVYSFCQQYIKSSERSSDGTTHLPWNMMVYIPAKEITGTIEEAIRDHLWCREEDVETLMHYVMTGEGVVIVIDALDEVSDTKVIESLKAYVKQRHSRKGGPQVLLSCRTDRCFIDDIEFDRFLVLEGFTPSQGLTYASRYSENVHKEYRDSHHQYIDFIRQHKDKLEPVITNPLRLHLFCILASKGFLHLHAKGSYSIPNLLGPFETHILLKADRVSTEESDRFCRFCLQQFLDGKREFPESGLMDAKIPKPYLIFFDQHKQRNKAGMFETYYSFSHEVFMEYFAGKAINSLSSEGKRALILYMCIDTNLKYLQKIVFELLYQNNELQLMQEMIHAILLLQCDWVTWKLPLSPVSLINTKQSIKKNISTEGILSVPLASELIRCVNDVSDHLKWVINERPDSVRSYEMYKVLNDIDILRLIMECICICEHTEQVDLLKNTIHRLLPCQDKGLRQGEKWSKGVYAIDKMRWAEVAIMPCGITMQAWSPLDIPELLSQHSSWCTQNLEESVKCSYITFRYTDLWGIPTVEHWSKDAWGKLFNDFKWSPETKEHIRICLHPSTPLNGLFEYLVPFSYKEIRIMFGRVHLLDLKVALSNCRKTKTLMKFQGTTITVPGGVEEGSLEVDRDTLISSGLLKDTEWRGECGDLYYNQHDDI